MTPERWKQISALFELAQGRASVGRDEWLEMECAGDKELRREVESLLAAGEAAGDFIARALVPHEGVTLPMGGLREVAAAVGGERVGPYEVIKRIGHGGMGAVYLAARADDQYRKRVAIKLVKRGMDTEAILRRFMMERQILAQLDHPHIARLLDGGTTADGLPYFVMEYIEGQPLNEYCDTHKLSIAERLELFRQVCAAVSYAHQNLVVHRDLKPSNILVTGDGTPKLLDFGIAKLLKPELFPQTIAPTGTLVRLMTPDYASPEQIRGLPITTASDIYSLGVLLYELLTGHRPYRLKAYTPQEIERVVCEEKPERPSTVISRTEEIVSADGTGRITITPASVSEPREGQPERLRRRLAGDLDTIILKALRKEPSRRYNSVEQFSEDLRRHLAGLPVTARKDTLSYRSSKFVKRHRAGVAVAAAFLLLIIAGSSAVLVQSARVRAERDRAQLERDKAERVSAFLVNLFGISNPDEAKGNTVTARELLERGAARIEGELNDQPETQAALMDTMGQAYASLGLYRSAAPLLERALIVRRQALGAQHPQIADSLLHLAALRDAQADYVEAEQLYREALALRRATHGDDREETAEAMTQLGRFYYVRQNFTAAESLYREALAVRRKLYGDAHPSVAKSVNNLAIVLDDQGDRAGAEPLYREALALTRKFKGDAHDETAWVLNNLASLMRVKGNYAEAERLHREALAVRRQLHGDAHSTIAVSCYNLSLVFQSKKDGAQAEHFLREYVAVRRRLHGAEHPALALALRELGAFLLYRGDAAAAEPVLREALAMQEKLLDRQHPQTSAVISDLGVALYEQGRLAEAESLLREALRAQRLKAPPHHPLTCMTLLGLGKTLTARGHARQAEPLLREALDTFTKLNNRDEQFGPHIESALGESLTAQGRYAEAKPLLAGALARLKELAPLNPALIERTQEQLRMTNNE